MTRVKITVLVVVLAIITFIIANARQNTSNALPTITTNTTMRETVDDGYTYPKNATEAEKAAIDEQEFEAWVKAGKPGANTTDDNNKPPVLFLWL